MKTIAYLRVSTEDQDLEKDKGSILLLANRLKIEPVEFVEEKISGKISWKKRKIYDVVHSLKRDDNILVTELSRLGRSMLEIMEMLAAASERKINVYAIKGDWKLDGSIQSKIMAMIYSMFSEIERDLISTRTKQALQARKERGEKLGRPEGSKSSLLDPKIEYIQDAINLGWQKKTIAKMLKCSDSMLYQFCSRRKIKKCDVVNNTEHIIVQGLLNEY